MDSGDDRGAQARFHTSTLVVAGLRKQQLGGSHKRTTPKAADQGWHTGKLPPAALPAAARRARIAQIHVLQHREAHIENDKTNRSGSHSLDNNPRVLAGQALHPKYKCIL
jgi:hypothetical protein